MPVLAPSDLGRLNQVQLEILKVFSMNLPEDKMQQFQQMLLDFYFNMSNEAADRSNEAKGRTNEDLLRILEEHPKRTPYK